MVIYVTTNSMDVYWGEKETNINVSKTKKRKRNDNIINHFEHDHHPLIYKVGHEIHFSAEVSKYTIEILKKYISQIVEKFYKTHNEDEKLKITYIVDSPGGSVTSVLKFVDFVGLLKAKYPNVVLISIISGMSASAATTMSIVADKRYMTKNAHAMIHELSSGNSGRYTQMISYAGYLTDLHTCLVNIYLPKCNKTKDELEVLLKNDTWYTAKEYLDHGFVDEIK